MARTIGGRYERRAWRRRAILLVLVALIRESLSFNANRRSGFPARLKAHSNSNLSSTDETDRKAVEEELGYLPSNFLCVSSRISSGGSTGRPVAIKTYPLNGGAKRRRAKARAELTPFPTLYWLCNSEIGRAIADLERRGYVRVLEERIQSSDAYAQRLRSCHEVYARERLDSLSAQDRAMLESGEDGLINERMASMIRLSGVAGTDYSCLGDGGNGNIPSIKCLHAHYAHYRSGGNLNIVGEWTHDLLREQFPDLSL